MLCMRIIEKPTAQRIDALLPQTQCGECGYSGCMPYAEALAAGVVDIDRCPPGGVETMTALAHLLKKDPSPYLAQVAINTRSPTLAVIDEAECIGCTKCIQACPVDAIIGAAKRMHSVLTHECTGCGLCVEPCPVNCIEMQPQQALSYDPHIARQRFQARQTRLLREEHQKQHSYRQKKKLSTQETNEKEERKAKQAYILQALARVQSNQKKQRDKE